MWLTGSPSIAAAPATGTSKASTRKKLHDKLLCAGRFDEAQVSLARHYLSQPQPRLGSLRIELAALLASGCLRAPLCHVGLRRVMLSPLLSPPVRIWARGQHTPAMTIICSSTLPISENFHKMLAPICMF